MDHLAGQRPAIQMYLLYAVWMDHGKHLVSDALDPDDQPGNLETAARTARTGSRKHNEKQDHLCKGRPKVKVASGKSRGGDQRYSLEARLIKRLPYAGKIPSYTDADADCGCQYHQQINPQFLVAERLLRLLRQKKVIDIEADAAQQHKHHDDSLYCHGIGRHAAVQQSVAARAHRGEGERHRIIERQPRNQ